jgi:hypothetical protein
MARGEPQDHDASPAQIVPRYLSLEDIDKLILGCMDYQNSF